jgi:hypothetical protein
MEPDESERGGLLRRDLASSFGTTDDMSVVDMVRRAASFVLERFSPTPVLQQAGEMSQKEIKDNELKWLEDSRKIVNETREVFDFVLREVGPDDPRCKELLALTEAVHDSFRGLLSLREGQEGESFDMYCEGAVNSFFTRLEVKVSEFELIKLEKRRKEKRRKEKKDYAERRQKQVQKSIDSVVRNLGSEPIILVLGSNPWNPEDGAFQGVGQLLPLVDGFRTVHIDNNHKGNYPFLVFSDINVPEFNQCIVKSFQPFLIKRIVFDWAVDSFFFTDPDVSENVSILCRGLDVGGKAYFGRGLDPDAVFSLFPEGRVDVRVVMKDGRAALGIFSSLQPCTESLSFSSLVPPEGWQWEIAPSSVVPADRGDPSSDRERIEHEEDPSSVVTFDQQNLFSDSREIRHVVFNGLSFVVCIEGEPGALDIVEEALIFMPWNLRVKSFGSEVTRADEMRKVPWSVIERTGVN